MNIVALDTETVRIGPGNLAPKIICASFAHRNGAGELETMLVGNHPDEGLENILLALLRDPESRIVTHNGGYDYACAMESYPKLIPFIFDAIEAGRCTDTLWREKLLNLSTTGRLEKMKMPDGSKQQILYGLSDLEMGYFGRDRSGDKDDTEESWRANYSVLDGWHSSEYPDDARTYALEDGEGTLLVYEAQEERKEQWHMAQTTTEEFQLASSFALYLMSCWGMATDPVAVDAMSVEVSKRLDKVVGDLVKVGFLRAPVPSAPYLSQQKKALKILGMTEPPLDWSPYQEKLALHKIKFTAAKEPTKDTKRIQAYVAALFKRLGKIPEMTAGGDKREPQIQMDAEVQEMLSLHDPVMEQFQSREVLAKLVGQQLPLLRGNAIVYPRYDALKETGRTSSYGNKKGKPGLYPAVHIQGIPKDIDGIDPRQCYVPRPGRAFFDNDYTALELACVGQITYELFGESVHLTRYNQGVDLHGYLGAQLVVMGAADGLGREFTEGCRAEGILSDPVAVYEAFMLCKKHEDEAVRKFWKEWRSFAKPVGLGFPGGLGPETMVEFARKTYKVTLTEEQAREFREMWRAVYPEMPRFFDWINGQTDEHNDGEYNDQGRLEKLYYYETPLGMVRRGASFCAAANGKCMQSPGAEGAKVAMIRLQRACYDPTQNSVLFGCRPIAFVHDQVIGETTEDASLWHEQCMEARRIMCDSMQVVLPDIKMRSDEAHLTSVWSRMSVPTFDKAGRLIPWSPLKAA